MLKKIIKISLRLLVYPLILGILLITYNINVIKVSILFIIYGGEWITYYKDDKKTIKDIYDKMKS